MKSKNIIIFIGFYSVILFSCWMAKIEFTIKGVSFITFVSFVSTILINAIKLSEDKK